jgi:hypothetical protein
MTHRAHPPKIECCAIPEDKPDAKPNPFKIGESVRLRDGKATNGTVSGILGNQVLVAWDNVPGDPQWYHQDFVATERSPLERDRPPLSEDKPDAKPNPFKIGECVRLRDGTFTNGTIRGILINNPQQSWGFEGEPPKAVIKDFGRRGWTS